MLRNLASMHVQHCWIDFYGRHIRDYICLSLHGSQKS